MQCEKVQDRLSKYQAGECSESERLMIGKHLAGCPHCAAQAEEIRQLDELLNAWQPGSAPEDLWTSVMDQVENIKLESQTSVRINKHPAKASPSGALLRDLVAAAAASLILSWNAGNWLGDGQLLLTGKNVSNAVSVYTRLSGTVLEKATGTTGEYTRKILFKEWKQK